MHDATIVCRIVFVSCYFRIVKNFLQLTETTGDILQTTLRSYLKIVHRKSVSLISHESKSCSLQYFTFSSTTMSSRSLPLNCGKFSKNIILNRVKEIYFPPNIKNEKTSKTVSEEEI